MNNTKTNEKNWFRHGDLVRTKVHSNIELSPGVFYTGFAGSDSFVAGQLIAVTTDPEIPPRMYSMAGSSEDPLQYILYDLLVEGELTPRLAGLKAGDFIYITKPFGSFIPIPEPMVWISTGTGVAPFLSMILSGKGENSYLVHGGRTPDRFWFQELLTDKMKSHYIRCCSGIQAEGFYNGRVSSFISGWEELPSNRFYYLCGRAEMVVEVRQHLLGRGISFDRILSEIYF